MKIEVNIPDDATVGTAVHGKVIATGNVTPPPIEPPPPPPPPPPPTQQGQATAPWGAVLPVQILNPVVGAGQQTFPAGQPSSSVICSAQLMNSVRNAGFSSPPPVFQGCYAALGTQPGFSDVMGWTAGPDNVNLSIYPAGGQGMWLSMVLDPTHPQPPGTSFYSAN